ncbi:MAG TPA: cupin domain-containing protein [Solirubrobacteraceae bacterium]|nr:cupin domain-containing protein [Solirubrobacteraceae bacterium]
MPKEARLKQTPAGKVPEDNGWFVLNAREARWLSGDFGAYTRFEGEERWRHLGFNIGVLQPGQPSCYYHGESDQEDFLVLSGECLLLIEGNERRLKAWDFVHCPPWTEHVFVGAGDGPCAVLAVGSRAGDQTIYPESGLAQRHGAGAKRETREPSEAYAELADDVETPYQDGWLPDF